jgi:hypothetical protein
VNWEAIGAIGEIFGALAVLVSVIYLGLQIRGEARRARTESSRERVRRITESLQHWADSQYVVPMMVKLWKFSSAPNGARAVVNATGLDDEDAVRYSFLRQATLQGMQATILDAEVTSEEREVMRRTLGLMIAQDGVVFSAWWTVMKGGFAKELVEVVNRELAKQESTGSYAVKS